MLLLCLSGVAVAFNGGICDVTAPVCVGVLYSASTPTTVRKAATCFNSKVVLVFPRDRVRICCGPDVTVYQIILRTAEATKCGLCPVLMHAVS